MEMLASIDQNEYHNFFLCRVWRNDLANKTKKVAERAVHTMCGVVWCRTVGNVLTELVLNYDGVHTMHSIVCRHSDVTAEI